MTLTEFLLARIAEDEEAARGVPDIGWPGGPRIGSNPRVLAECDAKRRIVGAHLYTEDGRHSCAHPSGARGQWNYEEWEPCVTLASLALPYSDHPDYRAEWKP